MTITTTRPLVLLATLLLFASLTQAADLAGTFANDQLTLTLAPSPTGYSGTLTQSTGKSYPVTATSDKPGSLTGHFSDGTTDFPLTAHLENDDTLVVKSVAAIHRLTRVPAPASPAAESPRPESLPAPDPASIDAAIRKAKAYLYSVQANGTWDLPDRQPEPTGFERKLIDVQNSSQWGGITALATYTLLTAGDNPQSPNLAAPLAWLKKADLSGTYALACRLLVWNAMPQSARKEMLELAKRDRDLLLKNKRPAGRDRGLFRYLPDDPGADHSASQFAVLGLFAADQLGAEVPTSFWREAQTAWLAAQQKDGGWNYTTSFPMMRVGNNVTPSMTAAGVASLFITGDALQAGSGADCRGNVQNKSIDAGIAWINNHADSFFFDGPAAAAAENRFPFYTLYGVERISLASGLKYIGSVDWYKRGAYALLASQNPDGSFGADASRGNVQIADTCFAVLFLARGRAPIALNKLQYALDMHGDKPRPANWNQRPRDAANATRWLSRQLEREVQWQIVNLSAPVEDLHDAPILYLAGNQELILSDADEAKLKTFVQQGGLILANADCASANFAKSFKKLGEKLFPPYEFRELPAGHLIYENLYQRSKWKNPPQVQGLSNGARELMLLLPTADPARFWQTGAAAGHEPAYELLANTFLYCSENRDFRARGQSYVVTPNPNFAPSRTLKVARIQHDYNWDPEPAGWPRLAAILHNENQLELTTEPIRLGQGKLDPKTYKLAHLTTTTKLKLKDTERAELKSYLESGGTLLADATAGQPEAATALESELAALLSHSPSPGTPGEGRGGGLPRDPKTQPHSNDAPAFTLLPPDSALYTHLALPPDQITYRAYATKRSVGQLKGPRLRAATIAGPKPRPALLYSPEDLSVGLVGTPVDGIYGYSPTSATALVKAIVMSVAEGN